jgi:hypothetical protein
VVGLAQLGRRAAAERAHEVLDVEPVGAAGAGTLLLLQPDLFLGSVGRALDRRQRPIGSSPGRQGDVVVVGHVAARVSVPDSSSVSPT